MGSGREIGPDSLSLFLLILILILFWNPWHEIHIWLWGLYHDSVFLSTAADGAHTCTVEQAAEQRWTVCLHVDGCWWWCSGTCAGLAEFWVTGRRKRLIKRCRSPQPHLITVDFRPGSFIRGTTQRAAGRPRLTNDRPRSFSCSLKQRRKTVCRLIQRFKIDWTVLLCCMSARSWNLH